MKNSKPIQTLQELAQSLRADCYYFVSPCSAGDTYRLCMLRPALESHYKGKIIFVIKAMHEAICEMFDGLEYVICEDKSVDFCRNKQCLILDNVVSVPTLGKIYSHFINYEFGKDLAADTQLDFDRVRLMLPQSAQRVLPTNLPQISESLCAKLHKIAPLDKIILFCPEANSFPRLPFIIFKDECQRLRKEGYSVVVNTLKYKKEYARFFIEGVYDLDLSLKEAIALGISCAGVISTRAGFCDIVAHYCKKLKIYYTAFSNYIMWDRVLPNTQRVYVCDVPIYKKFLQISRESLPMKLYKRYATKGFLRKLRLPFTAYFKIYRRHKNEALQDFNTQNSLSKGCSNKKTQEFIQNELAQTYEYNLGRALQRACERFWWGGFLLFPFDYLKIRKEKGKGLRRISNVIH